MGGGPRRRVHREVVRAFSDIFSKLSLEDVKELNRLWHRYFYCDREGFGHFVGGVIMDVKVIKEIEREAKEVKREQEIKTAVTSRLKNGTLAQRELIKYFENKYQQSDVREAIRHLLDDAVIDFTTDRKLAMCK